MAELDATMTKGPAIPIDEQGLKEAVRKLQATLPLIHKLEQSAPIALQFYGEEGMRRMLRHRTVYYHQMDEKGLVKGYISISISDIDAMGLEIQHYLAHTMNRIKEQQSRGKQNLHQGQSQSQNVQQTQQPQQRQPQRQPQQPQQPPVQQQAQRQQQQPQKSQPSQPAEQQVQPTRPAAQRKNSETTVRTASHNRKAASTKPPAAPTSEQPPFQLGEPSPHGVPVYAVSYTHLTLPTIYSV